MTWGSSLRLKRSWLSKWRNNSQEILFKLNKISKTDRNLKKIARAQSKFRFVANNRQRNANLMRLVTVFLSNLIFKLRAVLIHPMSKKTMNFSSALKNLNKLQPRNLQRPKFRSIQWSNNKKLFSSTHRSLKMWVKSLPSYKITQLIY